MPIHSSENTYLILRRVQRMRPKTVLDIGCGSGSYGLLFRDILDRMRERYNPADWKAQIDAIEIWPHYLTPVHSYVYNHVIIGDIRQLAEDWPPNLVWQYDFVFLGDVIEHMTMEEGRDMLAALQGHAKEIVVSTPIAPHPQGAYEGNEYEAHVSRWATGALETAGLTILNIGKELITAVWSAS